MKIGDKVFCYRSIPLFNKGDFYKIGMVTPRGVYIEPAIYLDGHYFKLKNSSELGFVFFDDYFYTKREIRKLKLEKINNNENK